MKTGAECFAVWLSSPNRKRKFKSWDCFPKMEYLDHVMKKIGEKKPKVSNKFILDPISESTLTLREYYEKKRKRFKVKSNLHLINVLKKYKSDFYIRIGRKNKPKQLQFKANL